jgi:hypothetical protein
MILFDNKKKNTSIILFDNKAKIEQERDIPIKRKMKKKIMNLNYQQIKH